MHCVAGLDCSETGPVMGVSCSRLELSSPPAASSASPLCRALSNAPTHALSLLPYLSRNTLPHSLLITLYSLPRSHSLPFALSLSLCLFPSFALLFPWTGPPRRLLINSGCYDDATRSAILGATGAMGVMPNVHIDGRHTKPFLLTHSLVAMATISTRQDRFSRMVNSKGWSEKATLVPLHPPHLCMYGYMQHRCPPRMTHLYCCIHCHGF